MKRRAAALACALLIATAPGQTPTPAPTPVPLLCTEGVCFERTARLGERELAISGAGTLTYLGFRVYSAALHAPADARDAASLLGKEPVRLELRYHREISAKDITRSARKALAENPELDFASLEESFAEMTKLHRGVRAGDKFVLSHEPGSGLRVQFNREPAKIVGDDAFARAYLGIWLSAHPLSKTLKGKLLAGIEARRSADE